MSTQTYENQYRTLNISLSVQPVQQQFRVTVELYDAASQQTITSDTVVIGKAPPAGPLP